MPPNEAADRDWRRRASAILVVRGQGNTLEDMKVRTSITLSESIIDRIDALPGNRSRSQLIQEALTDFLARLEREDRDRRDLEILNREAESFNLEAEDVLGYQVDV